jgi:hypothetical protein
VTAPLSPEEQALARVVGFLERLGIAYMVTGSLASSFHGRPRATHDADIVVDPSVQQLDRLVGALASEGFYVDSERARDALRRRRQFNVIDIESTAKIDLIVVKDRPFSREELARRRVVEIASGLRLCVASPEDTLLSKLEWARAGGSERQLEDAAGVAAAQHSLDRAYIERWARELGVLDAWQRIAGRED